MLSAAAGLPQRRACYFHTRMPNLLMGPNVTAERDTATFDDEQALQACAGGDRKALQALYQRESRHLPGVALRIVRHRQQAGDVLHDAL